MIEPREIWTRNHQHIGHTVRVYESVPSTNDLAAALSASPIHYGTAILADAQTAGRGTHGRTWHSQPGTAIIASIIIDPILASALPVIVTAWVTVAVAETIRELTGLRATIKWPNDVLIDGKKVCGILIERQAAIVVGIGLNLNQTASDLQNANLPDATSLSVESGRSISRDDAAELLFQKLDARYEPVRDGIWHALETTWVDWTALIDQSVTVEHTDGSISSGRVANLRFGGIVLEAETGHIERIQPERIRQIRKRDTLSYAFTRNYL